MANIIGERCILRSVEIEDIEYMYRIENDIENWNISGTTSPFSHYLLSRFVESQSRDIYANRELRLIITTTEGERCGIVDLFEFDPTNLRAGVGIVIDKSFRERGLASDALKTLARYCKDVLNLIQLWCGVASDNIASITLFEHCGYTQCGVRHKWLRRGETFIDEIEYQILL
ncbi:MAG: GNAT family N-acetyltransferase [Rikenellaceae bacterium]